MIFVIDIRVNSYWILHSKHTSYEAAKREINAGWSLKFTRRLKVVDERILYKAKAGKYMDDGSSTKRKHPTPFK